MRQERLLHLLYALCGMTILTMADASAQPAATETKSKAPSQAKQEAQSVPREKLISDATSLIKDGRFEKAHAMLAPYQTELAGDPDFDYLLGIAALDSGKPNEAIFALERVLAMRPGHLQARAEIARAYLAAGETAASKQEFETVQKQNPPKEVSATIQKYLDIIETGRAGLKTSVRGYVEATAGNDSNVNNATSSKQIAVPFFGGAVMDLNASGVANRDTFGSLGAGFSVRHEMSADWALMGGANVSQRNNSTQKDFNTGNADANFGVSLRNGKDSYLAALQLQRFALDDKSYRDAAGASLQWQRNLDSGRQVSSYLQYSSLSYPDNASRDANRHVLGAAYATPMGNDSVLYTGIYAGAEQERQSNVPYIGYTLYGARIGGEMKLSPRFTALASASVEKRKYGGEDPLFLVKRDDTQGDLKAGINYMPVQQWTLGASLGYTSNDSNIIINEYDRTVFSVTVRRDFD